MTLHRHHRKRRSQGGSDDPVNIMWVTPEDHDWIHRTVDKAYAAGMLIRSWQEEDDPSRYPFGYDLHEDGWRKSAPEASEPQRSGAEGAATPSQCPRCQGRGTVEQSPKPEKPRKRVTLGIRLPKDADENGIEVLQTLLSAARDELRTEMGWKENVPPYYVLVAVLHDWLTTRASEI